MPHLILMLVLIAYGCIIFVDAIKIETMSKALGEPENDIQFRSVLSCLLMVLSFLGAVICFAKVSSILCIT